MIIPYTLLLLMTILGSIAAIFLKKATTQNKFFNITIGGGMYFITAIINIYILKYLDYSIVLPMTSVTYIWTLLLAKIQCKENINYQKLTGIILIIVGSMILTQ